MVKANRKKKHLRPRPLDHGDPRTPMAWQHRNLNYQQNQGFDYQSYHMRLGKKLATHNSTDDLEAVINLQFQQRAIQQARPASPSTSGSSSSTADPDKDSHMMKFQHSVPPDIIAGSQPRLGTLRSMQSTLSTWERPCPQHQSGSSSMPPMFIPSAPSPPHYAIHTLPATSTLPPPMLLPPMLRPRPLVLPANYPLPPTPLPVRDPKRPMSIAYTKNAIRASSHRCCLRNILLFWIILAIILVGALVGVIARLVVS